MSVRLGTVEMSYTMQPCGIDGKPINGGNHYANAYSIEDARAWADTIAAKGTHLGCVVRSVTISGEEREFTGSGWARARGGKFTYEVIPSTAPYKMTAADLAMHCYDTTVMDYFETVHPLRGDGTCQCGNPTRNAR